MVSRFVAALVLFGCSASLFGQEVLFQTNFDSDDGFVVLSETEDILSEFGYDYSDFDGIPEAPNSGGTGGDDTSGLRLEANLFDGVAAAVAVVTTDLDLSGQFEVQLDAWLNYNYPAGTAGTTEFGGLGIGHNGEFGGLNGASFIYDTDGDSARDYILYKDLNRQEIESGQYAVPSMNNTEDVFVEAFPPLDLEVVVPEQSIIGETNAGTGGFRWTTITATVDTDAVGPAGDKNEPGVATFTITDAGTGISVEIGTIDNSQGEDVANLTGNVAVLFADLFSSVSNDESLSFGVFDNLIVRSIELATDPLDCNADGSVTGGDLACATADSIAATLEAAGVIAGDLDLDGSVGFPDFLVLSANFGNADQGGVYANGDIDLDGSVAFPDFLTLSANFGQSAAASAVPEPSSWLTAIVGLGLMISVVRRHRR